jgi:protein-L-isoaspartate(D-aspartate) O-methyltransferase
MFSFQPTKLKAIEKAMDAVDRIGFVRQGDESSAYQDHPLPIGYGQTISQPTTVKYMLYWLDVQPGDKVLDLGSGSGWTSAILAGLVGNASRVTAVDRVEELVYFGRNNCSRAGFSGIQFFQNSETMGWPQDAPYDRILVSAAASGEIPQSLVAQLAPGGKLVVPVDSSIYEVKLKAEGEIGYCHEHYGFVFVPLISPPA